jgi:hypothetical protein
MTAMRISPPTGSSIRLAARRDSHPLLSLGLALVAVSVKIEITSL